jgi:hypothetical protein
MIPTNTLIGKEVSQDRQDASTCVRSGRTRQDAVDPEAKRDPKQKDHMLGMDAWQPRQVDETKRIETS